jgi:hypothetical protein
MIGGILTSFVVVFLNAFKYDLLVLKSIGLDHFPVDVRKTTTNALVGHPEDILLMRGKCDF